MVYAPLYDALSDPGWLGRASSEDLLVILRDAPPQQVHGHELFETIIMSRSRAWARARENVQPLFQHSELVLSLLRWDPDLVHHRDQENAYLLHLVVLWMNLDVEVVRRVLSLNPRAVTEKARRSQELPLHFACSTNASQLAIVELLVQAYPEGLRVANASGDLPLHRACTCSWGGRAPIEVVRFLGTQYPEGLRTGGQNGMLPLHSACHGHNFFPQRLVIDYLLNEFPEGVNAQDTSGRLPLHVACRFGKWDTARALITAHPAGVRTHALNGEGLPIHVACADGFWQRMPITLDLFALLVEKYPDTLRNRNAQGRLALHCAFGKYPVPVEVLQRMIDINRDAMYTLDSLGWLPLHLACQSQSTSVDYIRLLVAADPLLLLRKTHSSGETPLQCAHYQCPPPNPLMSSRQQSLTPQRRQEKIAFLLAPQHREEKIAFLLAEQERVMERHRLAAVEFVERRRAAAELVAGERLRVDDLVMSKIWDLAKPDVWTPQDEDE